MSNSLCRLGLQHARLFCPLLSPKVFSDSCPLSQWCYLAISSSAVPISFCFQSFPASGSLPMSQLKLQLQHQSCQWISRVDFLSDWLVWPPCSPRDSWESSPAPQFQPINSSALSLLYSPALTSVHDYWKNHALTILIFVGQVMPVLFNTVSSFVIAFLPKNKHLLISWLQSPSAVILKAKKIVCHCFHHFPIYLP